MQERKKILVLIDWFLPGIKAGGPVRSVSSMISRLNSFYDFYILTSDTDFGDTTPYAGIVTDKWIPYSENVQICYLSKNSRPVGYINEALNSLRPDVVYINSLFSKDYSILPLRLIRNKKLKVKTILAPRGMLSEGALRIKPLKKKLFLYYARLTGLHKNVSWHSTKADETAAIRLHYGNKAVVYEAQNISDAVLTKPDADKTKQPNELNLVYLGRIAENKNLLLVLKAMQAIKTGNISLDIYGSKEDSAYWKTCEELIATFPNNLMVHYKGVLQPEKIASTLRKYHFLIQLSYSENFGHSIVEALSSGVPVIISNATPWKGLQKQKAGWDLSIDSEKETVDALQEALVMDQQTYSAYAEGAYGFAEKNCVNPEVIDKLRLLFA